MHLDARQLRELQDRWERLRFADQFAPFTRLNRAVALCYYHVSLESGNLPLRKGQPAGGGVEFRLWSVNIDGLDGCGIPVSTNKTWDMRPDMIWPMPAMAEQIEARRKELREQQASAKL